MITYKKCSPTFDLNSLLVNFVSYFIFLISYCLLYLFCFSILSILLTEYCEFCRAFKQNEANLQYQPNQQDQQEKQSLAAEFYTEELPLKEKIQYDPNDNLERNLDNNKLSDDDDHLVIN